MNINELNAKEYEFCKDEEDAFQADPTVRNQVVVLCKRDEFNRMMLRQQQAEIEALKNAKRFIQNFAEEQHQRAVALEMRELTDEEIHKLWLECWDEIDFARAILKKAQEK